MFVMPTIWRGVAPTKCPLQAVANSASFDNSYGGAFAVIQRNEQIGAALGNEIITTTFLLLVVCMTAVNAETKSNLAPVCVALTVVINVLVG